MRIGTVLTTLPKPLDEMIAMIAGAEEQGFTSVWLANTSANDALTVLALAGRATSRIELGTGVVPTYPRHPVALAQQALTVQVATGGRLALGIGLSHRTMIEDRLGLDYSRPVPHMREYLTVLDGLLAGEAVEFRGEEYRVSSQLSIPGSTRPPVVVAALGPAMLKLTGRLADGTITWMGGIDYLRDVAVPILTEAARKAGRPAPRVVAEMPVCVTEEVEAARTQADWIFRNYGQIPSYRATLDRGGANGAGDVAVVGAEAAIESRLDELARIGVTDFIVSPFALRGGNMDRTMEFMADLARRQAGSAMNR